MAENEENRLVGLLREGMCIYYWLGTRCIMGHDIGNFWENQRNECPCSDYRAVQDQSCHNEVIRNRSSTPEGKVKVQTYKHDYYLRRKEAEVCPSN